MTDKETAIEPDSEEAMDEKTVFTIQLRNGEVVETVEVKWDDLEDFIAENDDKIVYHHFKARGPRRSDPKELDSLDSEEFPFESSRRITPEEIV